MGDQLNSDFQADVSQKSQLVISMLEAPQLALLLRELHPVSNICDLSNLSIELRWFHLKDGRVIKGQESLEYCWIDEKALDSELLGLPGDTLLEEHLSKVSWCLGNILILLLLL